MILYNTSDRTIEARYDGKPYTFAPGEKKNFYDPSEINHLVYKLEDYGLVQMMEGTSKEDEAKLFIEGLRKRRHLLDFRVRNYRTMNKERESNKLSPEPPSDLIIETVDEIEMIDAKLKSLLADKYSKVDSYMKTQEFENTEEKIQEQTKTLNVVGSKSTIGKGSDNRAVSTPKH